MLKARWLLELARQKYPEQFNQRHGLYLSDDGKLIFTLVVGQRFEAFELDDTDMHRDPDDIFADIEKLLSLKAEVQEIAAKGNTRRSQQ